MVNRNVRGIVYNDRCVYNSDFHDVHLLNVKNVQKLIPMCILTKPNVLFSDVVKKNKQSEIRTRDSIFRRPKAKVSRGTSVQWYGIKATQTGMQLVRSSMNQQE